MQTSQEQSQEQLVFEPLVINNDYEIALDHYPYIIRKRSNHRVIKEYDNGNGYRCVTLNKKKYLVHRIVALQFLHNDDPEHKTVIDHINHDRSDNRLSNLRWCTSSENSINISRSSSGNKFEYLDELGVNAFEVTSYNNHTFDTLYFDPEANCFYIYTGAAYREVHYSTHKNGALYIRAYDVNNVRATISLNKFKKSLEEDDSDEE